jgi:hypothetical protein
MQSFKETDEIERRMVEAGTPLLDLLSSDRTEFYNGAFQAFPLGDIFINLNNAPLARAIPPEAFRKSFFAIFQLFTRPGTFEYYLTVFRAIFGDGVDVAFAIPAPGQLEINIETLTESLDTFTARTIIDNAYVYDQVIDHDSDFIVFQGTQGLKTQDEIDKLMKELQPAGVYVEADLTLI